MTAVLCRLIVWYRRINAALVAVRFPLVSVSGCRSVPTCSEYALQVIRDNGAFAGLVLAVGRVARCHPFSAHVH